MGACFTRLEEHARLGALRTSYEAANGAVDTIGADEDAASLGRHDSGLRLAMYGSARHGKPEPKLPYPYSCLLTPKDPIPTLT
jgi:hypothetical protein